MESKKLNLNQPLLSVRKYSPNMASKTVDEMKTRPVIPQTPPYRSDLKSGPVGNPGAVPFQWEQIPGQPKEEIKRQIQNAKLPPKATKYDSQQVSSRAIDDKIETVNIDHDSLTGSFMDVKSNDSERSKEKMEDNTDSGSGDRDEAYMDALESLFLHCGRNGSFSMDQRSWDFIKDRFLPQYASKKQSPVQEEEKSDDECDDEHVNLPAVCCLLPRFCLKSLICILNPVSATSMRTRVLTSPANRIQPRSSSTDEYKSHISELKPVKKSSKNEGSRLKSYDMSTHCEDKDLFALPEETGIKGLKTFQELLADQCSSTELDSGSSLVEKTVCVATVEKVENTKCCSVDTQDTKIKPKGADQMHVKDSPHQDIKIISSVDKSNRTWRMETPKGLRENLDYKQDSTTTENIEVSEQQPISTLENFHEKHSEFPVLPPLRSPSDSWLRRTLPSYPASATCPRNEKAILRGKLRLNRTKA